MLKLALPTSAGALEPYALVHQSSPFAQPTVTPFNRTVYAAAHVVVDPLRMRDPWDAAPAVDWDATLAFRAYRG